MFVSFSHVMKNEYRLKYIFIYFYKINKYFDFFSILLSFHTSYERWMSLAPPFLKVEKGGKGGKRWKKVDEFGSTFFKGGKGGIRYPMKSYYC